MTTSQAATLNASIDLVPATSQVSMNPAIREAARSAILLGLGSVGFLAGVTLLINTLFANLM